tara:strand:- start:1717 stop:2880 length:1164 start_codon:yes stop_codon:yes gene_type:complete
MNYNISHPTKEVNCEINIPGSKSISNRVLIIRALCKTKFNIENLSDSDDTNVLKNNLNNKKKHINIGASGTALRFLTSYLATQEGINCILSGSERIQERPIKELVNTLNKLGADICYVNQNKYAPLKISGKKLKGGEINIKGDISSQFISSILLIAPTLEKGIKLNIIGKIVSKPYIDMTLSIMKGFGINYSWKNNTIHIANQNYTSHKYKVESDWSSAAFWMQIGCLSNKCIIKLKGMQKKSIQGDKKAVNIFSNLGIKTSFNNDELKIEKNHNISFPKEINLIDTPDLYQPLKCILFALDINCKITGLQTLKNKETDRIKAIKKELKNLYKTKVIETYNDHRMAMSFAPLSLKFGKLKINNSEVVSKSYPDFWKDLKRAGFIISL